MKTIIDLILVACVTIFIVDLSGFTDTWRSALARILRVQALKPLPPFDCSLCMTWWVCLIYALASGRFSLPVVAFIALLAFLSNPIGQLLLLVREVLVKLTDKLFGIL